MSSLQPQFSSSCALSSGSVPLRATNPPATIEITSATVPPTAIQPMAAIVPTMMTSEDLGIRACHFMSVLRPGGAQPYPGRPNPCEVKSLAYPPTMETVAAGIHQVSVGSNAFIVDGDEGVTLVDTGLPKSVGAIAAALEDIGRLPSDVNAILVTHAHVDHGGGAAALKELTGSTVHASTADAPALEGKVKPPPPPIARHVGFLLNLLPGMDAVVVDQHVSQTTTDGLPGGFSVVETPGHTDGHVSYLLDREGGILFVGDAAIAKNGEIRRGFFNALGGMSIVESIRHLAGYPFEVACFGHSGPLTSAASDAFGRFAG